MKKITVLLMIFCIFSVLNAEAIRVACLGNSITSGTNSDPNSDPDTYPAQLNVLLGPDYDVKNFGVSGRTLLKHGDYPIWNEKAFSDLFKFNPNIITISLGTNDSKEQCWVYQDEFVEDYCAMIDTFRTLPTNPTIYLCLPPPAFKFLYDIRDSIITTDIIPMINQVAVDKQVETIDFYTAFIDRGNLFYDGIHPTDDGCWEIAKIIYKKLSGTDVQEIQDVNLALNKTVLTPISSENPVHLVDGSIKTLYLCQVGESFTVDMGEQFSVDMFQTYFAESGVYQYKIESSLDNSTWNTAIDQSSRNVFGKIAMDRAAAIDARYIRFALTGTGEGKTSAQLAEFKILLTAPAHGPILYYDITAITDVYVRIDFIIASTIPGGYLKYYSKSTPTLPFAAVKGYHQSDADTTVQTIRKSTVKNYYAKFYKSGFEVASDSILLDFSISAVQDRKPMLPQQLRLQQNYPNPFNPATTIAFSLPCDARAELSVYNVQGQKVKILVEKQLAQGDYTVSWNGQDSSNRSVPSGIYICRLAANGTTRVRKMLLVR